MSSVRVLESPLMSSLAMSSAMRGCWRASAMTMSWLVRSSAAKVTLVPTMAWSCWLWVSVWMRVARSLALVYWSG
ncbi:MAG: hypothetical protein BWX86_01749 [Verrucomicrobia bacterium ADurb.Bin122]|nr:MAG: hypothetical protein BWX86_01749 [Verrucomicrobia bacterium ADurb.Bin122]